jgi:hypothetical protein
METPPTAGRSSFNISLWHSFRVCLAFSMGNYISHRKIGGVTTTRVFSFWQKFRENGMIIWVIHWLPFPKLHWTRKIAWSTSEAVKNPQYLDQFLVSLLLQLLALAYVIEIAGNRDVSIILNRVERE